MEDTLLLNKITSPRLPPTILYRDALVQKLNEVADGSLSQTLSYKLVLLCSPAGYGKTTLLADFARRTAIPCCWYFLELADVDRVTFLTILLASIRQCFPAFGKTLDSLLTEVIALPDRLVLSAPFFDKIIDAFLAAIEAEIETHFAIFLCNYHEVNQSQNIHALMNRFLEKLPAKCIVFIESRALPKLEFAPLITQRKLLGLGRNILRLTSQEIRELAALQGTTSLGEAEVEQLATSFDGWIAGILLGTRLGDIQFLDAKVSTSMHPTSFLIQGDRKELFAYLLREVFSREPENYAFLRDAAVLQYMVPDLCQELLHVPNAHDYLQYLEQQGLFITCSSTDSEKLYTCHPLVRELLYLELREQFPERCIALHRQAAEIFLLRDDYEPAVYHAFQADDTLLIERLIIAAQKDLFARGHIETLARWIDDLARMSVTLDPDLLLVRARIHLIAGEFALATTQLDLAEETLAETDDSSVLRAKVMLLRSKILFQKGDYLQAQMLSQKVLLSVTADEVTLRAEACTRLGVCANLLGDLRAGITYLQKALQLCRRDARTWQVAELHSALASTYCLIGNFALAEHYLARAISCWEHLQNERGTVDSQIRMGLIEHYQGSFSKAEAQFSKALALSHGLPHFRREEAYALVSLGELYQDQRFYDRALNSLEDGLALARYMEDRYLTNYALCILAMTHLLLGDTGTAMLLIAEFDLPADDAISTGYERALRELVYGTILLYDGHASEAHTCLMTIEHAFQQMGFWREQLQVTLRIAASQHAQGDLVGVSKRINHALKEMWNQDVEVFITIELHHFPELERYIHTLREPTGMLAYLPDSDKIESQRPLESLALPETYARAVPIISEALPELRIQAFGEPVVSLDGVPIVRWHLARAMELFFFLLESGRPMRKEQILTALWPDSDGQVEQTLRTNVYYARKILGENAILYRAGTYELKLAPFYRVKYDIEVFENHTLQARRAREVQDSFTVRAELLKAIDLYRGDYVRPFYSDWCTFRRNELRQAYLDIRQELAQLALRQKQFAESLDHWQHMLAVDNCLEEAYDGLIRCYLLQGKRSLALRQYQRCLESLKNELGVEPGPALQRLYQQLIDSPS